MIYIYTLMKKVIILKKIHVKMKFPLHNSPPQKETKHIHTSAADVLHTVLDQEISVGANGRSSHWRCSVKKGVLKNFAKFTGKHLCRSLSFNKVAGLEQLFLQSNSGRLLQKCRHCKNEAREKDCLCCGEVDAMLLASAKIPENGGSVSLPNFYGHLPNYQSHVLALSTKQMSPSFGSWCS